MRGDCKEKKARLEQSPVESPQSSAVPVPIANASNNYLTWDAIARPPSLGASATKNNVTKGAGARLAVAARRGA